jgi:hypothetical protein
MELEEDWPRFFEAGRSIYPEEAEFDFLGTPPTLAVEWVSEMVRNSRKSVRVLHGEISRVEKHNRDMEAELEKLRKRELKLKEGESRIANLHARILKRQARRKS